MRAALGTAAALVLLLPGVARAMDAAPAAALGLGAPALSDQSCADKTYPECRRIRYAYGPLTITPGANFQVVAPGISKPGYDGYALRLAANLYRADGTIPPVDEIHLHHAVWFSIPQYGNFLPFFGAGEEKTTFQLPSGYGLKVRATDQWYLNYMIHNLTPTPEQVYVVYDIDYVPAAAAEAKGVKRAYPLWLDVLYNKRPYYPVFNAQRGYGHVNPATGAHECTYPKERCAAFDPYGNDQPGNGTGYDWKVPRQWSGTLIGMGGHVHPGGLRDDVDIVRGGAARHVFTSDAVYWDTAGPISWDLSMTVTKPGWRVQVKPGDTIRLNATYDTSHGSWYEGMGIVMAWVAPDDHSGVDPFQKVRKRVNVRVRSKRSHRTRVRHRYRWDYVPIDTRGVVTHGHLPENNHHGGDNVRPLPTKLGPRVEQINIDNFQYRPGDLSQSDSIPTVSASKQLVFDNHDASVGIWHTVTSCAPPCSGEAGISYPLADSMPAIDSLELGWTPMPDIQPASNRVEYKLVPDKGGLHPGDTVTYFCRVHPFMRGAFKVVK
ncbi:MAG: hypothetical protein ACJ76Z_09220 [Thermoleophilaceae bacterium]